MAGGRYIGMTLDATFLGVSSAYTISRILRRMRLPLSHTRHVRFLEFYREHGFFVLDFA